MGGYGQQPIGPGMRDQGMPPGHVGQPGAPGMMMGGPPQDQWGGHQQPPPMYNQARPMGKCSKEL